MACSFQQAVGLNFYIVMVTKAHDQVQRKQSWAELIFFDFQCAAKVTITFSISNP